MDIERTDDHWFHDDLHGDLHDDPHDGFLEDEDPYGYGELEDLRATPPRTSPTTTWLTG